MLNEKFHVEVRRYKLAVEMEGLTQLEVMGLARTVSERMDEIEGRTGTVDTYKLAIRTCLDFAAEVNRLKAQQEAQRAVEDQKIEGMVAGLQGAL